MGVATEAPTRSDAWADLAERPFSILCDSRQDWDAALPTNRQQIMRRAAARGHEVVFVETGHFLGKHLARALRGRDCTVVPRLFRGEQVDARIAVRRAVNLLPWGQRFGFAAAFNRRITARALAGQVKRLPRPVVLWIYDPVAFSRPGEYGEDLAVYDVVDDYAEQAGEARRAFVAAADARAGRGSRLVFATTTPLRERHLAANERTHLVRNVGDFAHFAPARDRDFAASEVRSLPRPVLGFAGNFTATKVDFALLEALADAYPDGTLLLVGPANGRERERLERLSQRPNVAWLGQKPYAELPRFVAAFDVGLIPYVESDYTRSCFPLKLFEYLAAEKPVVATGLPELRGMEPDVVLATGPAETVDAVRSALAGESDADRARRSALASSNTWDARTERLLGLVTDELEASR
jgi:glycosyltransferase involved in cell wall biosynthesis